MTKGRKTKWQRETKREILAEQAARFLEQNAKNEQKLIECRKSLRK